MSYIMVVLKIEVLFTDIWEVYYRQHDLFFQ